MISCGRKLALDFTVAVVQDDAVKRVQFAQLLTRPTIVSVHMRNNTGGCDRQNDALVAHAAEFDRAGYNLVAVSRDTPGSHRKYAAKKGITYALVSDPGDLFAKATDSVVEKSMYGRKLFGPARAAYVIGRDGTVLALAEKVDTADHGAQLKALLATLK